MKLTIFLLGLLAVSTARSEADQKAESSSDSKDKREAPVGHYGSSSGSHTTHMVQIPSRSHGGSNAISIGAGYSIAGGKHGGGGISYGGGHSGPAIGSAYKSATAQQNHQAPSPQFQLPNGQVFSSLEELMQSLRSSGLQVGAPTHGGSSAAAASLYGAPHAGQSGISLASLGGHQAYALPQATYGSPKLAPITLNLQPHSSVPSYAAGVQGLGAYASGSVGSTAPQLFAPAQDSSSAAGSSHSFDPAAIAASYAPSSSYGTPSSDHSFAQAGQSFADLSHSLGISGGHSHRGSGGISLGGLSGHSFSGPVGHSFGGSSIPSLGASDGHTFSGSDHSFGGLTSLKGSMYGAPSNAFKPSAFLGASFRGPHGESYPSSFVHSSGISADSLSGLGGHGASFNSDKFSGQAYLPPLAGFGSSHGGHLSADLQNAFSGGHSSSPPGTSYGVPSGSYGTPGNAHVSSSNNYYKFSSRYPSASYETPSFGHGSSAYSSPSSSNRSFGSSIGSLGSSHGYHQSPSSGYGVYDSDGDHSEASYNTIKYSSHLNTKKKHM